MCTRRSASYKRRNEDEASEWILHVGLQCSTVDNHERHAPITERAMHGLLKVGDRARKPGRAEESTENVLFPRRTVRNGVWAGLLTSGSIYSLHLPVPELTAEIQHSVAQWFKAAFVLGYSGGTATDLHRFPYSSPTTTSVGNTQHTWQRMLPQRTRMSSESVSSTRSTCSCSWVVRLIQFDGIGCHC